ncbi:hypothetical protein Chor_014069 [Crotalus horridus]
MALTLQSEGSVSEEAGGLSEKVEGKVAVAATLETPGCSGTGALYEQGSRSESSCEGNEEMEDEEEMMEEGTAGSGASALFGGFGTEEGEMDCDDEDEVTRVTLSSAAGLRGRECRLDRQLQDIVYKLVVNLEETAPQPMAVGRGRPRKVVGSVFRLPPELDMSLLLEFIGANDLSGNFKPLEKKFVRVSGEATIGHVEKFLRRKMDLDPGCQV